MEGLWTYLLYLYGLLVDAMFPCENLVKLQANELNRDQYLGRWLFIAAASSSSSSLETFAYVDSTLFSMNQTEGPEQLQLRAAIRLDLCVERDHNYFHALLTGSCVSCLFETHLSEVGSKESYMIGMPQQGVRKQANAFPNRGIICLRNKVLIWLPEGRPHMRTELFSAKCPNTIVVQETDQDYQRILFYSRILHPEEHCLADFWNKASCLDMNELLLIPRTQDACEFQ